jgi:signal transduction histidine kinase
VQLWQQQLKKNSDTESAANNVVDENSIQIVVDEIDRLSRLVRRLLYFSKPAKPVWQTLNIEHVFDRAASMVHFNHTFELVSSFAPDIPLCKGDAGGLEQIFINGLVNAIEAMPEGGNVAVAASYDVSRDEVLIEISDNGPGIPSELRNKIFEPFFTTKSGGVGLGLAICKEIIQSHNGSITIRENIPNGTILSIRISTNRNK